MRSATSSSCLATLALVVLGTTFAAAPSAAFRMIQNNSTGQVTVGSLVTCDDAGGFTHWTTDVISWRLNTANQGSGKTTALQAAMASWTNVANANHMLGYAGTTTAGWGVDGINTIEWSSATCTEFCLALTGLVLVSGQEIVEADITFNNSQVWNTNGTNQDTEAVAAHEFGHALGIHHTDVASMPYATMRTPYFGSDGRTLESDDVAALQCSQTKYPVGPITLSFTSAGDEDGRITESSETSGVGGTVDSTSTGSNALRVGDTGSDEQYRSILSFTTGAIPDGATILSATLELRRGSSSGTNPFTTHSPCRADISTGTLGGVALVASDFEAGVSATNVVTLSNPASDGALSSGNLNSTGRNAINKNGRTQFRIYCNVDDDDDSSADWIGFYPGETGTPSNRPKLTVVYQQ